MKNNKNNINEDISNVSEKSNESEKLNESEKSNENENENENLSVPVELAIQNETKPKRKYTKKNSDNKNVLQRSQF